MSMESIEGVQAAPRRIPDETHVSSPRGEAPVRTAQAQEQSTSSPVQPKAVDRAWREAEVTPGAGGAPTAQRGGMKYRVDDKTDQVVVEILDESKDIIKQIPPEELLKAAAAVREMQALLFDTSA